MDFVFVVLILLIYYIRPQDWVSGLIGVGIVTPIMAMAIFAMVTKARQEGRRIQFLVTPLDWWMLVLYGYIVFNHPQPYDTFKGALPLFAFYFVTVQALSTSKRLNSYLKYWLVALTVLAMFGLLSTIGIDPTGAHVVTVMNKGRLALGTWMHNNPNALAHSVVVIVPLAYFLLFWKGSVSKRFLAVILWIVAFECVYLTESKGAVLAGFVTAVLAYVFGKSKIVQVLAITAAIAGGGAAISVMPRMSEMSNLRADEGVQGRLLAWEQARTASRESLTGQGWKTFRAVIRWEKMFISKATHSGYVQVGAELGPLGMGLYIGAFWLGLRSLFQCKTRNNREEACRRCLFALLIGFAISNWMIDRAYHTELFLFFAGISALHRLLLLNRGEEPAEQPAGGMLVNGPMEPVMLPWSTAPQPMLAMAGGGSGTLIAAGAGPRGVSSAGTVSSSWAIPDLTVSSKSKLRARPTLVDVAIAAAGAWSVFYLWDYILKNL